MNTSRWKYSLPLCQWSVFAIAYSSALTSEGCWGFDAQRLWYTVCKTFWCYLLPLMGWHEQPWLPQKHLKLKTFLFLLSVTLSDLLQTLVGACRQNLIVVWRKREKTKSITASTPEDGVAGWWWQLFFFGNVTTSHEGPGCQDVENIWKDASEGCFHCWRQSSSYLTFTLSCRQRNWQTGKCDSNQSHGSRKIMSKWTLFV